MAKNLSDARKRKAALKKFSNRLCKKFGYASASVLEHFSGIVDPREEQGRRHPLISIIVIGICATICGADGWVEMVEFGEGKRQWLSTFLELPYGIPKEDTFRRVFNLLDPEDFQKRFVSWINMNSKLSKASVIAIDGKTMRGSASKKNGVKPLHIVSAWASEQRLSLGQVATEEKSNEITAIPELLKGLCIEGCIITIDAAGCQVKIAALIVKKGADYVLALKGNQGTLNDDVQLYFEGLNDSELAELEYFEEEIDKGHGRIEVRRCWVCYDIAWLEQKERWPGLKAIIRIQSERQEVRVPETASEETKYYISSLEVGAEPILQAIRGHWGVENGLHWVLDVAFREDLNQILSGSGARNLGILRHVALNLLNQEKTLKRGVKTKRLRAACDERYLEKILLQGEEVA